MRESRWPPPFNRRAFEQHAWRLSSLYIYATLMGIKACALFNLALSKGKASHLGIAHVKTLLYFCSIIDKSIEDDDRNDNGDACRANDSAPWYNAWFSICLLHERGDVCTAAKTVVGLCIGCDGGSFGVVVAYTCHGDGVQRWFLVCYAGSCWFSYRYRLSVVDRRADSTPPF